MNFSQVTNLLYHKIKYALENGCAPQPVFLVGPPGIGKTTTARTAVDLLNNGGEIGDYKFSALGDDFIIEVKDLTSTLPEDLGGLPTIYDDAEGRKRTGHAPFDWFVPFTDPEARGIIVLDDITQAPPSVSVAARQLVLDRAINGNRISDNVLIVVTGNRASDGAAANTLPSHFRNAVNIVECDPDLGSWRKWWLRQGGDPGMVAFLRQRTDLFSKLPNTADERGAFPTPRTWAKLGYDIPIGLAAHCLSDIAAGYVGEGHAIEFMAFYEEHASLPDTDEVLRDPKATLPSPSETLGTPDKMIGMMVSLAARTASKQRDAGKDSPATRTTLAGLAQRMCVAVAHCAQDNYEYGVVAFSTYTESGGDVPALQLALNKVMSGDPSGKDFFFNIHKALRGV